MVVGERGGAATEGLLLSWGWRGCCGGGVWWASGVGGGNWAARCERRWNVSAILGESYGGGKVVYI